MKGLKSRITTSAPFRIALTAIAACLVVVSGLGPWDGTSTARADVLSHPFLTWTVNSSSNYLSPANHLHLYYGTVLTNTNWYFTIQVVNNSGSHLDVDETTGLGATSFFSAPLYCSSGTCYYKIYFSPLIPAFASATLFLHAHTSGEVYTSAAISVSGTGIAPITQAPVSGFICQTCNLSLKNIISARTKVQLKTHRLHGGTLRLVANPQSLARAPININSAALNRLRYSSKDVGFAPMANGGYAIFSKGRWEGFVAPPPSWTDPHLWIHGFHIAHFIFDMFHGE